MRHGRYGIRGGCVRFGGSAQETVEQLDLAYCNDEGFAQGAAKVCRVGREGQSAGGTVGHHRGQGPKAVDQFGLAVLRPAGIGTAGAVYWKILARLPAGSAVLSPVAGIAEQAANKAAAFIYGAMVGICGIEKQTAFFRIGAWRLEGSLHEGFGTRLLMVEHPDGQVKRFGFKDVGLEVDAAGAAPVGAMKGTCLFPLCLFCFDIEINTVKTVNQFLDVGALDTLGCLHIYHRGAQYIHNMMRFATYMLYSRDTA